MGKKTNYKLGDLQLEIMKILWNRDEATVKAVQKELEQQNHFAYTTIATMLRKMEERGLVSHRVEGRQFIYRPAVTSEAVTESMTGHLLDHLFQGSLPSMVNHLLESRDVKTKELDELRKLISKHKRRNK